MNGVTNGRGAFPRRLLYVVTGLGWGGAESQVIDLASRFRSRGWEVAVAVLLDYAERRETLEAQGILVRTLGMMRGIPDPRAVARLARLIRSFSPTVVHAHMVHSNLLARITRLFAPVPVLISNAHNTNEGSAWRIVAYRLTDRFTDLTTNVSEAAVARAIERGSAPAGRIRFMPNGIDLQRFRRDDATRARTREALYVGDRFAWLVVARFEEQKDYPNLLDALARIADHERRPLVLAVGEGPRRVKVEAEAERRGLTGAIRFLGKREDVPALMNAADAYVMSSAWEGLPMVLLEAAASELPIVATDVGGNGQIVLPEETGLLIPPRNSEALATAMKAMMERPEEERRSMGKQSAMHVRAAFELEGVVDRWEAIYSELYGTAAKV